MRNIITMAGIALGVSAAFSTPAKAQLPSSECYDYDVRSSTSASAPYRTSKFRSVLNGSEKLQWPTQGVSCISDYGLGHRVNGVDRGDYITGRFFVTGIGRLRFEVPVEGYFNGNSERTTRMELRGKSWPYKNTATGRYRSWEGTVHLPDFASSGRATRFAVGQLFADRTANTSGRDAMGIVFERSGSTGKLKVTINNELGGTQADIILNNSFTSTSLAHKIRLVYDRDTRKVSVYYNDDWKGQANLSGLSQSDQMMYFKAGIYMCCNTPGTARVEFSELNFSSD